MSEQGKNITKSTRKTVKRLDFGVRRSSKSVSKTAKSAVKPATKPATKSAPKATPKSARPAAPKAAVKSASKPAKISKPAPKPPVVTRGKFIDFVPSRHISHPTSAPIVDDSFDAINELGSISNEDSIVSVKTNLVHEAAELSPIQETTEISSAPEAARHSAPRGIRMDFVSRLNFGKPKSKPDNTLEEELDSLDELSPDDFAGDDIDEIEAEIEAAAETDDFVKEPKPLFEDPLVKLSKVRERRESVEHAAEVERLKEEVIAEAEAQAKRSPYAALYSSDRSPFLSSVNVEKRPLSAAPANGASTQTSTSGFAAAAKAAVAKATSKATNKPSMRPDSALNMKRQLAEDAKEIHHQTMMMSDSETKPHNKTAIIIAAILTIILGAGVGAVIYLAFFQNN